MRYFVKISKVTINDNVEPSPIVKALSAPSRYINKVTMLNPQMGRLGKDVNINIKDIAKKAEIELQDDWQNLKYIAKHKAYLISPGRQLGLGYGQLLKHDLSKLTPSEWGPYSKFWFGSTGITGTRDPETFKNFRNAVVNSHYKKNKHHNSQNEPIKYKLEAVADWYSSAKTQSKNPGNFPDFKSWYLGSNLSKTDSATDLYIRKKIK